MTSSCILLGGGGRLLSASLRHLSVQATLPKKPVTPWVTFWTNNLPAYKKNNPSLTQQEIMKKLGQDWKMVPEAKKSTMMIGYEKEKAKWAKQKEALPENDKEAAAKERKAKSIARQIKTVEGELKAMMELMPKPKKPISSYLIFLEKRRKELPSLSAVDQMKQMGNEWKALSDKDKADFENKASQLKVAYEKSLTMWTRKMEKEGRMAMIDSATTRKATLKKSLKEIEQT